MNFQPDLQASLSLKEAKVLLQILKCRHMSKWNCYRNNWEGSRNRKEKIRWSFICITDQSSGIESWVPHYL